MTVLFKTSLDLSSFVWCEMTGLFKTSLDFSSFVWHKLTGLFKTSLEETKEFKVIKKLTEVKGIEKK